MSRSWNCRIIVFAVIAIHLALGLSVHAASDTVRGIISDGTGNPISRALVVAYPMYDSVWTDSDGRFVLVVPDTGQIGLSFRSPGLFEDNYDAISRKPTRPDPMKIQMREIDGRQCGCYCEARATSNNPNVHSSLADSLILSRPKSRWTEESIASARMYGKPLVVGSPILGLSEPNVVYVTISSATGVVRKLHGQIAVSDILPGTTELNSSNVWKVTQKFLSDHVSLLAVDLSSTQQHTIDCKAFADQPIECNVRATQSLAGVPVLESRLLVQFVGNYLRSVEANILPEADIVVTPRMTGEEAFEIAKPVLMQHWRTLGLPTDFELRCHSGRLRILVDFHGIEESEPAPRLVWEVSTCRDPVGHFSETKMFIDAHTGDLLRTRKEGINGEPENEIGSERFRWFWR